MATTALKKNVIFDLDGTLSDGRHRLPYIQGYEKNWEMFHAHSEFDAPKTNVIQMAQLLHDTGSRITILTGRNGSTREITEQWLANFDVPYDHLEMRKPNDRRHDTIIKPLMARRLNLNPDNVFGIFEDRQRVVDMWRDQGFTCFQVDQWKEH